MVLITGFFLFVLYLIFRDVIVTLVAACALLTSFAVYMKKTNRFCKSRRKLNGKTCLVTGGTGGLGLEIAKELASRGAKVIIACPFDDEGIAAEEYIRTETESDKVFFKHLDLASLTSTRRFADEILKESRLDLLINNAGYGICNKKTEDGLNLTMQINYFGHFLLTILLLPILKRSGTANDKSRILNTSSLIHYFGTGNPKKMNQSNGSVYSTSKLCCAIFSYELAKRLRGQNVVVNTVDPGVSGTGIYKSSFGKVIGFMMEHFYKVITKTPWEGCQTALHVSLEKELGDVSGVYFRNCRPDRARSLCSDDKITNEFWNETVRLMKLDESEIDECLRP